jgi:pimeloyl-ACP methyl ester carboxylesterase
MHPTPTARRSRSVRLVLAAVLIGVLGLVSVGPAAITSAGGAPASAPLARHHRDRPTIVLVHGSFADASGFDAVIRRLQARGYTTIAPSNPLRGVAGDAAYIRSVLDTIEGPIVLVAHSYGGMVITNAATGAPDVKALV